MAVTRRMLLGSMARIGGAGAVYETLAVLDFLRPPPALAAGLTLPADSGKGKSVAILGAGVAGLCAAYELDPPLAVEVGSGDNWADAKR